MSTDIGTIKSMLDDIHIVEFYGGEHGMCVQLTTQSGSGYVQFTVADAVALCAVLANSFIEPARLRLVADLENYDLRGLARVVYDCGRVSVAPWVRASEFVPDSIAAVGGE